MGNTGIYFERIRIVIECNDPLSMIDTGSLICKIRIWFKIGVLILQSYLMIYSNLKNENGQGSVFMTKKLLYVF